MTMRVAINGFGRMGRLALRAAWGFAPEAPASLTAPAGAWGDGTIDIEHGQAGRRGTVTARNRGYFLRHNMLHNVNR